MADAIFEEPRLAALYDGLHPDRRDLDAYVDFAEQLRAHSVIDVGCGTGTLACLLARRGLEVTALDPAKASIEIARRKPDANKVRWLVGDLLTLTPTQADLVTMTANVAQVFLTDEEWETTLRSVSERLRPGGHFVFETRDPSKEAWKAWTRDRSFARHVLPEAGVVETWVELIDLIPPIVSFRWSFHFEVDGAVLRSESTLRFRGEDEVRASLNAAGFVIEDGVRDAPDRPGLEFVFVAKRAD
jgi:SAM-dependent methyltransferase